LDASILNPEILYEDLKLLKDRTFNISRLRTDVEFIKTQVADLGYAFAQVKYDIKKNIENATVDIVFNVIPGEKVYINDVIISGNNRTLDRVIRRNVYLAPGDLFNLTDFNDSKNKLKRTGYFKDVIFEQKRVTASKMDLIVKVDEDSTGTISLGGGYGSYDGFLVNASINEKNVFGSGKAVGVNIDKSEKRKNFKLSYSDPAIFDSKYNGSIEIHRSSDDFEYSDPDYTLDKEMTGFSISGGKEWFRNFYGGVQYRLDFIEESFDDDDSSDGDDIKDPNDKGGGKNDYYKIDEDYTLSSLMPYIKYNSTDDFYFPRNGIKAGSSLEYAGLGGDSKFLKSKSYFKYYYDLQDLMDWDWIFKYRSQLNILVDNGKINQGDSFYLGGVKTVRGYKSYAFGPENKRDNDDIYKQMFSNSIELSLPLVPSARMRWGVFYDYGMIGEDSFSDIKRSGTGAFLEWVSPFGPMQFIFAQPIDDEKGDETSSFEFSLGSNF
jgi:outer membrane protein insertion porin family